MTDFKEFGLPETLVLTLEKMGITSPTPVQQETLPIAMEGRDVLASADTGTGKTYAYGLPLVAKLLESPEGKALILAPTRELAAQVNTSLSKLFDRDSRFKTALLIGGEPMFRQIADLKRRPRIIVGTPGRITDHLQRGSLSLDDTRFLVIDEADRMLDMGFGIQLEKIAEYLPESRQTMLFSATFPPNIEKLSQKYLRDPVRVAVGSLTKPAPKIKQEIIHTSSAEKFTHLLDQLGTREGSVIVFVKTKRGADRLAIDLRKEGHSTDAIHGDLHQRRRDRVIQDFRRGKSRIMVATDVAARGLDIPHIMHVINYDLPQCPEDYIHRLGRTARAGAEGSALCLVSPEDSFKWKSILRLISPEEAGNYRQIGGGPGRRGGGGGGGRSFGNRPQGRSGGFSGNRSRSGGGFSGGFSGNRERSSEGFRPRERSEEGSFRPRERSEEGSFRPRERSEGGFSGNRERSSEGFRPRERSEEGGFRSREGFRPRERSGEGFSREAPKEGRFGKARTTSSTIQQKNWSSDNKFERRDSMRKGRFSR